jgi:hypothetical protein
MLQPVEVYRIDLETTLVASQQQVSTDVEGEAIILNFDSGVYFGLDGVGARVWRLLEAPVRVQELRDHICTEFEVEPAQCEADLLELLTELSGAGLIEVRGDGGP